MSITKKQHCIAQSLLQIFFKNESIYEAIVENKKIVSVSIRDSMECNYAYEIDTLPKNTLERFFSQNYDDSIKDVVECILKKLKNSEFVYEDVAMKLELFVWAYYKSMAYLVENSMETLTPSKDQNSVRSMIHNIFDKEYINDLCETIKKGYKYAVIKSDNEFLLSDQYLSTVSLDVKNHFANMSNRSIGLKNTMILVPISSSYYIVFYNGNKPEYIHENEINILNKIETDEINCIIYKNSYIKVAGKSEDTLKRICDRCKDDTLGKTQCMAPGFFYNNKKEVFFYEIDKDIYELYFDPYLLSKYIRIERNDECACGSGKKYKKCCIEKGEKCKEMYKDIEMKLESKYRISPYLIVERNV